MKIVSSLFQSYGHTIANTFPILPIFCLFLFIRVVCMKRWFLEGMLGKDGAHENA